MGFQTGRAETTSTAYNRRASLPTDSEQTRRKRPGQHRSPTHSRRRPPGGGSAKPHRARQGSHEGRRGNMVAISMYRGGADAERRWPSPRLTLSAGRFRRLLRSRSLAVAWPGSPTSFPTSRLAADGAAEPVGEAEEVDEEVGEEEEEGEEQQQQQQQEEEGQDEQEEEEEEEQEESAVEDVDMDDAGEVVVGGDDADGNGDAEEGQGESEGFDPNPEASYLDGIEERERELNDKLETLNNKKHDLVQMLKQVLNAEEEIRIHSMQATLRAAMPQPSENAADGSSVSRQAPRITVDVNFGEVAGESDAGSNQGTPGRPVLSISPSTASFARSPFGSLQHNSGYTPRRPATFSTASPSRFAAYGHQGHPPAHLLVSLPGTNFVALSPSPAASGGSSSVFRDYRPPNSTQSPSLAKLAPGSTEDYVQDLPQLHACIWWFFLRIQGLPPPNST